MLPLHHDLNRWSGVCVSIGLRATSVGSFCSVSASGSPENRTQRDPVISRIWATSPRLPLRSSREGGTRTHVLVFPKHAGLPLPYIPSCLPVRTVGFEPTISWPPAKRDNQPSPRSVRTATAKWAGRCSNPRLLVFSQALHRLSYQPNEKARCRCDTGL